MKIAVLTDIHANLVALETVADHVERWCPDLVFVAGDIVNRGPRSDECWRFVKSKQEAQGWQLIRGNHEDYVIHCFDEALPATDPRHEMYQPVFFALDQLGKGIAELKQLPGEISKPTEYGEVRMVHASMLNNRDGIYPETGDRSLQRKIDPAPAVFITGHTHRPLIRTLGDVLVVNAGSSGLPFDMDTRPSYAQITWQNGSWQAKIIRTGYDIAKAEKDFEASGYLEGAGPLAELILLELQSGIGQLYQWTRQYSKAVLARQITVEEAVREFLQEPITKPYW